MKKAIIALVLVLCLCTLPVLFAVATPDPSANIKVWPVGGVETGDPIVTGSPADMMIYTTAQTKASYNVHLLLVLNEETYTGLDRIEITNGVNVIYYQSDFDDGITNPSEKIPQADPDTEYLGYPGCQEDERYGVGAVKDKLGTTGDIYYCIKPVFDYIDTNPTYFTITVYGTSTDLKVLVLAFGRTPTTQDLQDPLYDPFYDAFDDPFNEHSSWSGSTLIVPELATILLATASLSVFGLYTLKRKK